MLAPDGELPRVSSHLSRTADALRVVHDVLLREEWFVERPPLALAVIHPLTRLHCEMWRAHCVGPLSLCTTTATSYHTQCTSVKEMEAESADHSSSSLYVRVGDATVANPAASEDPPLRGAAGFTRPSLASPSTILAASPFTSSLPFRDVCSLIPPLTSVDAWGATSPQTQRASWTQLRRQSDLTPVINPSTPLYSLETYTEKVFKLPVGMKLGHVRIITTALPAHGRAEMELVRGFYAHVPAASTLSAAHRAAAAVQDAAAVLTESQRTVIHVSDTAPSTTRTPTQQQEQHAPVLELDSDGATSGAEEKEENSGGGDADALLDDEEDDWETAALLEEARIEEESRQRALKSSTAAAAATASVGTPPASNGVRVGTSPAAPRHDNAKKEAVSTLRPSSNEPAVKLAAAASVTRADDLESTPSSTSAVLNSVVTVLPPPCAWWLRRRLTGVGDVSTAAAPSVPLFVHCIEATRQWVTWVDELQRADVIDNCVTAVGAGDGSVDLRGVSLSGWSTAYVPDTLISPADLRHRNGTELFIEEALPLTLPLRGLHLETFLSIAVAVLERGAGSPGIWRDSLVALDLPHLRTGIATSKAVNTHALPSLSRALAPLRRLRYLSLNRSSTEVSLSGAAATYEDDGESDGANAGVRLLEELRLFCVPGLSAPSLAAVGRHGGFLRVIDLSSTAITEQDLAALVWGTTAQDDQDGPDATSLTAAAAVAVVAATQRSSPLVFLEELRLAACHSLLRLRPLPALPSLRRLTLQASGVRQLDDLVGCDALEELVLTRCEHVRALHPLWRLPHLRCVEADGVRQLQLEGGLLPPPPAYSTRFAVYREDEALQDSLAEMDETLLVAPLSRLNLSQASLVHGSAVGRLATALRDISGRLHSLTVLLLDHTAINDDAVEALAGLSSASGSPRGSTTTATAANVAATGLRELSVAGCLGVHHLGPLGLLPQLARVVADGSGVEHLDGLERSTSLTFLSLAHCGRVWSIAALAALPTLRTLDVSRTPLNDAGLLRFVFPDLVRRLVSRQLRGEAPVDDDTAASISSCIAAAVPSQVEELRLYQCTALRYLGCLAHLPRLRRLDVSDTAVFDRGFVGFFVNPLVLLRVQLWAAGAADGGTSWTVEEQGGGGAGRRAGEMAMAPIPDEVALLRAWRRRWALTTASAGDGAVTSAPEFVFGMGAAQTLGHVSLAYCAEVRGITSYALFHRLATLDLSGTAVDSAALLAFVNILHECCKTAGAGGNESDPHLSLVLEKDGLRASPRLNAGTGAPVASSTSNRCYTLTSLTLSFCHYLTDVRCCATVPSLRNLTLCGMAIDNASIDALAAPPPLPPTATTVERRWWRRHQCALRLVDVRYCRAVTDVSPLLVLQQQAGTLEELHLSHSGVTMSKAELRALNPYSRCRITV